MASQPAPFPLDHLRAADPSAATHIDALHAELSSDRPDRTKLDEHVRTLREHGAAESGGGLGAALESWYLDERTQAFLADLNAIGL